MKLRRCLGFVRLAVAAATVGLPLSLAAAPAGPPRTAGPGPQGSPAPAGNTGGVGAPSAHEPAPEPPPCIHDGDVDGNGTRTGGDAQLAFLFVLEVLTPTPEQACRADCNGDGVLLVSDVQRVFAAVIGAGSCPTELPDGAECSHDGECAGGHCANGTCCRHGDCCRNARDCPDAYSGPARCLDAPSCQGRRTDAVCLDFRCASREVEDDSGCTGGVVADDCGPYAAVTCTSKPVQAAPACPTRCTGPRDCDADALCHVAQCIPCVLRVAADSTAPQPHGGSWGDAFATVQAGIDAAHALVAPDGGPDDCEVWVAGGRYAIYQGQVTDTVQLRAGVHVYGGFRGTETLRDERDPAAEPTVLDGLTLARHVVTGSDAATLDGFVITGGNAYQGPSLQRYGGGMYNEGVSPRVVNCTFTANASYYSGGAMFNFNNAPHIENCSFVGNTANHRGGACYSRDSAATFTACRFADNDAGYWQADGGGLYASGMPGIAIDRCTFDGNVASGYGGGAMLHQGNFVVRDSLFVDNLAESGGGLKVSGGNAVIEGCRFQGNRAHHYGGGLSVVAPGDVLLENDVLFDNSVGSGTGGAIINSGAGLRIVNTTVFRNVTAPVSEAGGLHTTGCGTSVVVNSIFWGNSGAQIHRRSGSTHSASYSDIQDGFAGPGNIDADPLFVAPEAGDLRLRPHSPCIDAADDAAAPPRDAAGNARCDDPATPGSDGSVPQYADMGAFEYLDISCLP